MTRRGNKGAARAATETQRCAIYTRKSTAAGLEQEFNSLDAQRDACESYVASQAHLGWNLVSQSYDDGGFTGANMDRPAFQRLLADIEARRIDVVVVYKVDRLSRSLLDFARVMDWMNAAGVAFVSVTQNFSTADAIGRLTLNMLMSFAEFEREMIAERTRDKIAASRRRGKWTGGRVPLGYELGDKQLLVNDLEAVLVREIFGLYLEHRSALRVAGILRERGRTTKRHRSAVGRLHGGRPWDKADVLRVLKNPLYGGLVSSGSELHEGEQPALVERRVFDQVRALLSAADNGSTRRGRNPAYLLTGILFCASCGSALTPASTRKKGTEYRYYRCVKRDKQGSEGCRCRPLPARAIEDYVVERLREASATHDLAAEVTEAVNIRLTASRRDLVIQRKRLPREIAKLSAEAKALAGKAVEVEGGARQLLEERIGDMGRQLAALEARAAEVEREIEGLESARLETEWVARCLEEFDAVWDVLTPENRRRLLQSVVERVEVDEASGEVRAYLADLGTGDASDASTGAAR